MATYSRSAFFEEILGQLRVQLPEELRDFKVQRYTQLVKIYYQNERVHFEVWADSMRSQVEIGLDFEDGAESTTAYLNYFDQHIVEIKAATGPSLELERWTRTWGHLVEVYPIEPFDRVLAQSIGARMVIIISVLQPLVAAASIDAGTHLPQPRRFWNNRRKAGR